MNTPTTPEAVEAAKKRVRCIPMTPVERLHLYDDRIHYDHVAARILAARVEELEAKVAYLEREYTGWAADAKTIIPHQVIHE